MEIILIYCTCPDKDLADKIAEKLIMDKLVACSNCFPMTSKYIWDSVLQNDSEYILILKTINQKWELVKSSIEEMHTYEIPCIIKLTSEVNEAYGKLDHGMCKWVISYYQSNKFTI